MGEYYYEDQILRDRTAPNPYIGETRYDIPPHTRQHYDARRYSSEDSYYPSARKSYQGNERNSYPVYRRSTYIPPYDHNGNSLQVDISLVDKGFENDLSSWAKGKRLPIPRSWKTLDFETACGFTNESGIDSVVLTREERKNNEGDPGIQWIHMQHQNMSVMALLHILTRIDLDLDDQLIATTLLRQISEKVQKDQSQGNILEPLVLRGDSRSSQERNTSESKREPDRQCIFMNFSYLSLQNVTVPPVSRQDDIHFARGLLQTLYSFESTKAREGQQAICHVRPSGKSICVPQIWSLVIGNNLLITYSTHSLSAMLGENIQIQKPLPRTTIGPSVLRVTDPWQRVFFFSLDECKTWFELQELLYTNCELGAQALLKDDFEILLDNKQLLVAEVWPTIVAKEDSPFVNIYIRLKIEDFDEWDYYESRRNLYSSKEPNISSFERSSTRNRARRSYADDSYPARRYKPSNDYFMSSPIAPRQDVSRARRQNGPSESPDGSFLEPDVPIERVREPYPKQTEEPETYNSDQSSGPIQKDQVVRYKQGVSFEPSTSFPSNALPRNNSYERYPPQPHIEGDYSQNFRPQVSYELPVRSKSQSRRTQDFIINNQYDAGNDYSSRLLHPKRGSYSESRPIADRSYYRSKNDPRLLTSRSRTYGNTRSRPVPGGVIVNDTAPNDITVSQPSVYFVPKKKSVPDIRVDIDDAIRTTPRKYTNLPQASVSPSIEYPSNQPPDIPIKKTSRRRRSRSTASNQSRPPFKKSILPILMWPIGPFLAAGATKGQDPLKAGSNLHEKSSKNMPNTSANAAPPKTSTSRARSVDTDESSLSEVLSRINDILLLDSNHEKLFRAMEPAQLKDATFNGENKATSATQEPSGSRGDVTGEYLNSRPANGAKTRTRSYERDPRSSDLRLVEFSERSLELLGMFVPITYSNVVIGRYYGAMKSTISLLRASLNHYFVTREHPSREAFWIVEETRELLDRHQLRPLSRSLEKCSSCRTKLKYKTEFEAANHVAASHFPADKPATQAECLLWVSKHHFLRDERCVDQQLEFLNRCNKYLNQMHQQMQEIRDGVCAIDQAHNPRYRLPTALVEAFHILVALLLHTSDSLRLIAESSVNWVNPDWNYRDDRALAAAYRHQRELGNRLQESADDGKMDLLLMIRTQDYTKSVKRYEAVGPHFLLAMVLGNLQAGVDCQDLIDVYKKYIIQLSFQAIQFPRRRLVRSFKYLEDEIEILHQTLDEQCTIFSDYLSVLSPQSFRTTTESRVSMFELESLLIFRLQSNLSQKCAELRHMQRQIQSLSQQTKTSVEINDDDHGKAILVFTIVTSVFLPLSFVASFFGMNTVDIRDQTTDQKAFWIVAVPVTVGVLTIALLIGYRYEAMRERFQSLTIKLKRE